MNPYSLIIIGAGLSGLAAGIRYARFDNSVLILEKHSIPGGLNSYYYRKGMLLETGLHAMTNFAVPKQRQAPLNRLFRQLNLSRKQFVTHEQVQSRVLFPDNTTLTFSNDFRIVPFIKVETTGLFISGSSRISAFSTEIFNSHSEEVEFDAIPLSGRKHRTKRIKSGFFLLVLKFSPFDFLDVKFPIVRSISSPYIYELISFGRYYL